MNKLPKCEFCGLIKSRSEMFDETMCMNCRARELQGIKDEVKRMKVK